MASLKSLLKGIAAAGAAGLIGVAAAQPPNSMCNADEIDFRDRDLKKIICKPNPGKVRYEAKPKAEKREKLKKDLRVDGWQGCVCIKNPKTEFCKKGVKYKCDPFDGSSEPPLYLGGSDGGVDAGSDYDAGSQYDIGEALDGGSVRDWEGCLCLKNPNQTFCKKNVQYECDEIETDAGLVTFDAGSDYDIDIDAGEFLDGGVDAGSIADAGYAVDAGVVRPSGVSKYAGIIVPSFGYVSHDYALKDTKSSTSGLEEGVLVVPMVTVKGDKIGLVFQYTRDSYDGSSVNGKRPNEDSVSNNNLRVGAVYLSGLDSGKLSNKVVMAGLQYLREMESGKYTGREVDKTGNGFAGQARLILPHLFELPKNFNLGADVTGDIQSRAFDSESRDYGVYDSGFISNMQLGGNLVLSYEDFLKLSAGYRFRSVGNTELGVHASNSHYAVIGIDGARQNGFRYGARLSVPTENTGKGLDGRIYAGKGRVGFELAFDRYQQKSQVGPDTLNGSTFYFGGNLVIGTDAEQELSDLLGVRYRR